MIRSLVGVAVAVGLSGVLATAARAVEPMAFDVTAMGATDGVCGKSCVEVINASGEITNDTADSFVTFLSQHLQEGALRPVVFLNSPGGAVVGAMRLGSAFRKLGALVIVAQAVSIDRHVGFVAGRCMSACAYAFFGGKKRVLPPSSLLGIHRMVIHRNERDPAGGMMENQEFGSNDIVTSLADYTATMGIDPAVIHAAEQVAPNEIHIVTSKEIAKWRLASSHF